MSDHGKSPLYLRIALAVAVAFVVNTALVTISYSIWQEFQWGRYPPSDWIQVCIAAGLVSTGIVLGGAILSQWFTRSQSKRTRAKWQVATVFLFLSLWAVLAGTSSPDSDFALLEVVQVMHAKLFAEAQFFRFIFYDAIPMAIISHVLTTIVLREKKNT